MPLSRGTPEKAVEVFIDELELILFDSAGEDKMSDEEKVKRAKSLCAEVRLSIWRGNCDDSADLG